MSNACNSEFKTPWIASTPPREDGDFAGVTKKIKVFYHCEQTRSDSGELVQQSRVILSSLEAHGCETENLPTVDLYTPEQPNIIQNLLE